MSSKSGEPRGAETADPAATQIVDYSADYGDAFGRLNKEWLRRYFHVEAIDERILSNPKTAVLEGGGVILYAVELAEVLGTVALKHHGNGVYELTKMAVTARAQGRGLGRQLLDAAIARFSEIDGQTLYLESHDSLRAALALYESAGFHHEARPSPSEYERANVYMVYRPADS